MVRIGDYYINISDIDFCKIDEDKVSIKFKYDNELCYFTATDSEKDNLKRILDLEVNEMF